MRIFRAILVPFLLLIQMTFAATLSAGSANHCVTYSGPDIEEGTRITYYKFDIQNMCRGIVRVKYAFTPTRAIDGKWAGEVALDPGEIAPVKCSVQDHNMTYCAGTLHIQATPAK